MRKLAIPALALLLAGAPAAPAQAPVDHKVRIQNRCVHPMIVYFRWNDPKAGPRIFGPALLPGNSPPSHLGIDGGAMTHRGADKIYIWATSADHSALEFSGTDRFAYDGVSYPMMAPPTPMVDGDLSIELSCGGPPAPADVTAPPCPLDAAAVQAALKDRRLILPDPSKGPQGGTYAGGGATAVGARVGSYNLNAPGGTVASLALRMPGDDVQFYAPSFHAEYPDSVCDGAKGCKWTAGKVAVGQLQAASLAPPLQPHGDISFVCEYRRLAGK